MQAPALTHERRQTGEREGEGARREGGGVLECEVEREEGVFGELGVKIGGGLEGEVEILESGGDLLVGCGAGFVGEEEGAEGDAEGLEGLEGECAWCGHGG